MGVHGAGVVTAITVQDTTKVHQVLPAFPAVVLEQLRVLMRDLTPDAIKIGALVTPNLQEAADLTGCDTSAEEGTQAAACALVSELGARASLVKGGHRDGPPRDLLAVRGGGSVSLRWLEGERVPGGPFHGTSCMLSSAITAQLALGASLEDAVDRGRQFVATALRNTSGSGARARLLSYSCSD